MATSGKLLLAVILCSILSVTTFASSKRPAEAWNFYHFDGIAFKAGPAPDGIVFIAVREHVQPVVLLNRSSKIEAINLPKDSGVIAGICYFKSSGSKSGYAGGFLPCSRTPLLISTGSKQLVTVQTDENGYFLAVLPAGKYMIGNGPLTAEISVDNGITTLVPLMAGKRMVD